MSERSSEIPSSPSIPFEITTEPLRTEEELKRLRLGTIFILFMDTLISPASIIVTMWYPGICLAAMVSMAFTCVLLLHMAHGNIGFQSGSSCVGGFAFISSITASLSALALATYSILIEIALISDVGRPWVVLVTGVLYLTHFFFAIRTVRIILKPLAPRNPKTVNSSPKFLSQSSLPEVY